MRLRTSLICLIALTFFILFGVGPSVKAEPLEQKTISEIAKNSSLKTAENRDFLVFSTAAKTQPVYRFLIQSGLHGNERLPVEFVTWLKNRYGQGKSLLNRLPSGSAIDFLPVASPDGYFANTRSNSRGVNLNRNFSVLWGVSREFNGSSAFSEQETKAVRALLESRSYTGAVDVHGYSNWVVLPSSPQLITDGNKSRPSYARWLTDVQDLVKDLLPGYEVKTAGGLGDGGAFEDFAYWRTGTLAFCLEMKSSIRQMTQMTKMSPAFFVGLNEKKSPSVQEEDTFYTYETMIYRAFDRAIKLKSSSIASSSLKSSELIAGSSALGPGRIQGTQPYLP